MRCCWTSWPVSAGQQLQVARLFEIVKSWTLSGRVSLVPFTETDWMTGHSFCHCRISLGVVLLGFVDCGGIDPE
jgi:hypothetical protein